jgi:preprotein translocase subunit SecE
LIKLQNQPLCGADFIAQLVEHWSPKPGVGSSSLSTRAKFSETMKKLKILADIQDSYNELVHKVSWPTKSELANSAVVVMFASLIIAALIFVIDLGFEGVMRFFYEKIF